MNSTVTTYKKRIQAFMGLMDQTDPKWIELASWYEDMLEFELGKDFFAQFLVLSKSKAIREMETSIIIAWTDQFVQECSDEKGENPAKVAANAYRLGTEINMELRDEEGDPVELSLQQKMLDYSWWVTIKERIYPDLPEEIQAKLDSKQEKLEDDTDFF